MFNNHPLGLSRIKTTKLSLLLVHFQKQMSFIVKHKLMLLIIFARIISNIQDFELYTILSVVLNSKLNLIIVLNIQLLISTIQIFLFDKARFLNIYMLL